ncbi:hypothetical protein BOTBODRAFT_178906 [Botryobasidium botryosum FD-172 SS1]|uniref:Uncharacterized protein n=1 Tax=Botryobasidium botryosum (strain FD-172 SS1) TaxID=930990 RepID=A0A067M1S9_BOTB1|nr:hypothetical protein BOTBODRAFT_178906 [Botryobasidium botryosum FD-172 SS1]
MIAGLDTTSAYSADLDWDMITLFNLEILASTSWLLYDQPFDHIPYLPPANAGLSSAAIDDDFVGELRYPSRSPSPAPDCQPGPLSEENDDAGTSASTSIWADSGYWSFGSWAGPDSVPIPWSPCSVGTPPVYPRCPFEDSPHITCQPPKPGAALAPALAPLADPLSPADSAWVKYADAQYSWPVDAEDLTARLNALIELETSFEDTFAPVVENAPVVDSTPAVHTIPVVYTAPAVHSLKRKREIDDEYGCEPDRFRPVCKVRCCRGSDIFSVAVTIYSEDNIVLTDDDICLIAVAFA